MVSTSLDVNERISAERTMVITRASCRPRGATSEDARREDTGQEGDRHRTADGRSLRPRGRDPNVPSRKEQEETSDATRLHLPPEVQIG